MLATDIWAEMYAIKNGIGRADQNPDISKVLMNLLRSDDNKI